MLRVGMRIVKIFSINLILLVSLTIASGKEIWVGEDKEFTSIQDAIDAASSGDTIIVSSGIYHENLRIIGKNITLIGEERQSTIIDGSTRSHTIYVSSCNGITITGFTIRNAGGAGNDNIIMYDTCNATISNNIIRNSKESDGLALVRCSHITISNNVIEDNPGSGILLVLSKKVRISGNLISGNQKGISFQYSSCNNTISNNMIRENSMYGIQVIASSNGNRIFKNTFEKNGMNAYDICNNTWYNASSREGNYWDDYKGEDEDGDGIGDIPYEVPGGSNKDIYVLGFFEKSSSTQNKPPVADAGGPYAGYVNQYIQFDGSKSKDYDGYIKSYIWDFGDGTSGIGSRVMHKYGMPGNYTVTLTVVDDFGAASKDTTQVRVFDIGSNEPPFADCGGPYYGLVGEAIKFNASNSYDPDGKIVSYLWDFGDGEKAFGKIAYHTYVKQGTYEVTLTVTDDKGFYSSAKCFAKISKHSKFAIFINDTYVGVAKKEIAFSVFSNESDIVSYLWDFGDGIKVKTKEPSVCHIYQNPGVYNLTVTATNSLGENSTATAKVIVSELWKKEKMPGFELPLVLIAIFLISLIGGRRR